MIWMLMAHATVTVDGTNTGDDYGDALAVQTVQTGFGDDFSELNAAYGVIEDDTLHLHVTGNIEANFNSLWLWLDTGVGGQNPIGFSSSSGGTNPDFGFGGPIFDNLAGMRFDSGFEATHALWVQRGGSTFDVRVVALGTGNAGYGEFLNAFSGNTTGAASGLTPWNIDIAYDDSNNAGISGGTGAADAAAALAVTTGLEVAIPLASIGAPTGAIAVMAQINNGDANFLSNQSLGGLPAGTNNLGGDGAGNFTGDVSGVDYGAFAGDQFFVVDAIAPTGVLDCTGLARPELCASVNAAAAALEAQEGAPVIHDAASQARLRPGAVYDRLAVLSDALDTDPGTCVADGWFAGVAARRDLQGTFVDADGTWTFDGSLDGSGGFEATTSNGEDLIGATTGKGKLAGTTGTNSPLGGVFVRLNGRRSVFVGLPTTCDGTPGDAIDTWFGGPVP